MHQDRRGPPNNYRWRPRHARADPPRSQEQHERQLVPVIRTSVERGESYVHCFNCQERGHYVPQCPHKQKGKQPAVNIITTEVQQFTTRSKAKTAEWEEQDEIRKATQEWATKSNAANVERKRQDVTPATTDVVTPSDIDPIWQGLAVCLITLTMSKLLNLVPWFRQAMESRLQTPHKVIPTHFTEPTDGPTVIDHQNPAIKVLVQDTLITVCVVDGGSGVNVISKATCNNLGIVFHQFQDMTSLQKSRMCAKVVAKSGRLIENRGQR